MAGDTEADAGPRGALGVLSPGNAEDRSGFTNYDPVANNLVIAGIGGNPSNLGMQTRYRYWAPRTGFAYRATDNTVIRGGFGVSYMPYADNNYAYNYPVRSNNAYNPTGASPYTAAVLADGSTVATFQAGFPAPVPVPIPQWHHSRNDGDAGGAKHVLCSDGLQESLRRIVEPCGPAGPSV